MTSPRTESRPLSRQAPLTQDEINFIVDMRRQRWSIPDIRTAIHRTERTVKKIIVTHMEPQFHPRPPRPQHPPELLEKLKVLWGAGESAASIASIHGMTRNAVLGLLHRAKLGKRPKNCVKAIKQAKKAKAKVQRPQSPPTRRSRVQDMFAANDDAVQMLPDDPPLITSMEALEPYHCRWPIGDPGSPGFGFCGEHKHSSHFPYCARHVVRAYRPEDKKPPQPYPRPVLIAAE